MRKFALAEPNWLPAENEQSDRTAGFDAHNPETGKPGPPRPGNSKSNEPNPKCARPTTSTTTTTAAAAPNDNAPDFTKLQILWSARLTAGFAARALPPAPTQPQQQHDPGNTNGSSTSSRARSSNNTNQPDPYRDIQYRNPAGQLVVRPGISQENRPMSDIEWSVQNVLRRKYPMIHREILVGALEHAGHIQPGADPDFPNSVVGILPPEERFRNGPLIDPLKQQPNHQNHNQAPRQQHQQQEQERQP